MFDPSVEMPIGYNPEFVRRVQASRHAKAREEVMQMIDEATQQSRHMILQAKVRAGRIVDGARQEAAEIISMATLTRTIPEPELDDLRPVEDIAMEAAATFKVSMAQIRGKGKSSSMSAARQAVIAAVYVHRPDLSLNQIGKFFCRDHTTILHAVRKLGVWRGVAR